MVIYCEKKCIFAHYFTDNKCNIIIIFNAFLCIEVNI